MVLISKYMQLMKLLLIITDRQGYQGISNRLPTATVIAVKHFLIMDTFSGVIYLIGVIYT